MISRRQVWWLVALFGAAAAAACAGLASTRLIAPGPIPVTATPIPLSTLEPAEDTVGALSFLGGIELNGSGAGIGGLSALTVGPDGRRFLALSDVGFWVTGQLRFDTAGRLVGAEGLEAGPLRDRAGRAVEERQRDSESLALTGRGQAAVGFERDHRIWLYDIGADGGLPGLPTPVATPAALDHAEDNQGLEALARLADGRWVAFAEGLREPDGHLAWISTGPDLPLADSAGSVSGTDNGWQSFHYRTGDGFAVTDAAGLPDGGLLVLERSFTLLTGARARIVHVPATALVAGSAVSGVLLARLAAPLTVDNYEALAVVPGDNGSVRIFVGSDDNFQTFQRTLLLAFRWQPE